MDNEGDADAVQWIQLLDEGSGKFYYANLGTRETTWDPPPTFIKHEDIHATIETPEQPDEKQQDDPPTALSALQPTPVAVEQPTSHPPKRVQHPLYAYAADHFNLCSRKSNLFHKPQTFTLATRLCWEEGVLTTPLTQHVSYDHEKLALQAFRNISGFMGNRSSGKGQNEHCFKLLRNIVPTPSAVKDEIYCQLCKQLTGNPDKRAVLNGWHLLNTCLVTFPPSSTLFPHLESFLTHHMDAEMNDIAKYATDGLESLRFAMERGERKEIPSSKELDAIRQHTQVEIPVALIDQSVVNMPVTSWTTCAELSIAIAERLGIRKTTAFALFEFSPLQDERLVEGDERVLDLYALWERMTADKTSKKAAKAALKQPQPRQSKVRPTTYHLLYKIYLFLPFDDELVEEIRLMHLQAVHDIVTAVYVCPLDDCIELAAYQLHCRLGPYDATRPDVPLLKELDQYVPPNLLSPSNRVDIAQQILDLYKRLGDRSKTQVRLAYLRHCERLKLFGSTFFDVLNTRNRQWPTELVLAANFKGIRIVSSTDEAIVAQFAYVDIASWGYSSNAFVLVVSVDGEEQEHVFKTALGRSINDLIGAYVRYLVSITSVKE